MYIYFILFLSLSCVQRQLNLKCSHHKQTPEYIVYDWFLYKRSIICKQIMTLNVYYSFVVFCLSFHQLISFSIAMTKRHSLNDGNIK